MSNESLSVPRLVNPITGIDGIPQGDYAQPFFGYAPAETTVRLISCPTCGKPVSAAHLADHAKTHKTAQITQQSQDETFRLQTSSRLCPMHNDAYAERNSYAFRKLLESANTK